MRRVDGRGPLTDLHQSPRPTTLMMGDDNADVSGAKLPQPFLLYRVGRCGDQCPDPRGPCPWANQNSCPSLIPLGEGVVSPWMSLLDLISIQLSQFLLL
jgi:hypothetical protein